jgi:hypothetical protein
MAVSRLTYVSTGTIPLINVLPTFLLENHTRAALAACIKGWFASNRPLHFKWRPDRRYAGIARIPELRSPVTQESGHPRCIEIEMSQSTEKRERNHSKPRAKRGAGVSLPQATQAGGRHGLHWRAGGRWAMRRRQPAAGHASRRAARAALAGGRAMGDATGRVWVCCGGGWWSRRRRLIIIFRTARTPFYILQYCNDSHARSS